MFQCRSGSSFLIQCGSGSGQVPAAKPMQIHADPDTGQTLESQKVEFLRGNMLKICQIPNYLRSTKVHFLKGRKPGLSLNFSQCQCSAFFHNPNYGVRYFKIYLATAGVRGQSGNPINAANSRYIGTYKKVFGAMKLSELSSILYCIIFSDLSHRGNKLDSESDVF